MKQYKTKKGFNNNKCKKYQCKLCGRVCKSQDGLNKHIEKYCEYVKEDYNLSYE